MHVLSEYFKKDHFLSEIDARVKILVAFALLVMVLSYKGFLLPLVTILLCILTCIKMKIPLRVFVLRFSEPLLIACVVLILKFLFSGKDDIFSFQVLGIKIAGHKDGLMDGLIIGSRILGAVFIVAVMGCSTPFTEFMAGLSWLRVPKGFIEVLMFAYRFLFVLLEDALVIYNAQKNRLGYSNLRRGMGSFGILAGSLILKAFEHSHNITTAMIQRGYDGNIPILKQKPFKPSEVVVSAMIITAMGFVWKMW
jgi:cobalt/nickel transport system permease protein